MAPTFQTAIQYYPTADRINTFYIDKVCGIITLYIANTPKGDTVMRFCEEIEKKPSLASEYHKQVEKIKDWYKKAYDKYSRLLVSEALLLSTDYDDTLFPNESIFDLDFHFSTKSSYFSISDALVKLILSMYSFGPSEDFLKKYGIECPGIEKTIHERRDPSWVRDPSNELILSEILARVLRIENASVAFDLSELLSDRTSRNTLTHTAKAEFYNSAIRSYNSIRSMLVFIEPEYEDSLSPIRYSPLLSYDEFMASPQAIDYSSGTNILVVGSAHDISNRQRETIANMAWDMVIDLDGYSDCGGLLSSVQHTHIQREVLYGANANNKHIILPDSTLWYRCGEYLSQNSLENQLTIPGYVRFHSDALGTIFDKARQRNRHTTEIFTSILEKANNLHRTVKIVALVDDNWIIQSLIEAESNLKADDYFITWVGMSAWTKENCLQCFGGDEDDMNEHFRWFRLPIQAAFEMFDKYSEQWPARSSAVQSYRLPGSDGYVTLSQNLYNNLRVYFKPLYDGCEADGDFGSEAARDAFYHGNLASWNTISYQHAVLLKEQDEFKRMCDSIKSLLGTRQENGDSRLFFIQHKPGIGGTTLARQLAWELHKEYPVLEVHSYDSPGLVKQVEALYDSVVGKQPIILISDDTFPFVDSLCEDIRRLERRCILIVACREGNALPSKYSKKTCIPFIGISDHGIRILRERYRNASNLSETELKEKDNEFPHVFTDKMMKTPLIIGLYYMEKDFNIESYVQKALMCCRERRFEDFVAFLALCDRYGLKTIPASYTRAWLATPQNLIASVPGIESVISLTRDASYVDVYQFKHYLLADEFLKQYAEKRFSSKQNVRDAVYSLAQQLIDVTVVGIRKNYFHREELTLLIKLLIQNKKDSAQDFSDLMVDVSVPEYQRLLLLKLAESFKPFAEDSLLKQEKGEEWTDSERLILRLTSHAYAHLGRMYAKGSEQNFTKAAEMTELSFRYSPDNDPNICHMAGMALLEKLESAWKTLLTSGSPVSSNEIAEYRHDFYKAADFFDMTTEYGQPDYGIPVKLRLYYRYLEFIYAVKEVKDHREARQKLNDFEYGILGEFAELLDDAEAYSEIDEFAAERVKSYRERYEAKILCGDYGSAVEYYQNKVDKLQGSGAITEYEKALKTLVFVRIRRARNDAPNGPFYMGMKDSALIELKRNIELLLDSPYDSASFPAYSERSRLYHYWIMLAKRLSESIDVGIIRMQAWKEMEEDRGPWNIDPEPFYHEIALLYLNALSGSEQAKEKLWPAITRMNHLIEDRRYNKSKGNLYKIRDVFVAGREMGQFQDVSYCSREDDCYSIINNPVVFEGILEDAQSGYARVKVYSPMALYGRFAKVAIGRRAENSLSDQQIGHKIRFYAGLSFEDLTALSKSAKDISTGEILELSALQSGEKSNQPSKRTESGRSNPVYSTRRETTSVSIAKSINTQHEGSTPEATPTTNTQNATQEKVVRNGTAVMFLPQSITDSSCSGVFMIDGIQHKGQVDLSRSKQKKKTEILRNKLMNAKSQNQFIPGFIIIGEPKNGVYLLKSKQ